MQGIHYYLKVKHRCESAQVHFSKGAWFPPEQDLPSHKHGRTQVKIPCIFNRYVIEKKNEEMITTYFFVLIYNWFKYLE